MCDGPHPCWTLHAVLRWGHLTWKSHDSAWNNSCQGGICHCLGQLDSQPDHREQALLPPAQEGRQPLAPPCRSASVHKLEAVPAAPTHLGPKPCSVPRPVAKRESRGRPPGQGHEPSGSAARFGLATRAKVCSLFLQPRPEAGRLKVGYLWELLARSQAQLDGTVWAADIPKEC